jgi:hypothetical protein
VHIRNPAGSPFSLRFEIRRGPELTFRSAEELVLEQGNRVERYVALGVVGLEAKTYRVSIVLNDVRVHDFMLDFGSKELP